MAMRLAQLNALGRDDFVSTLAPIWENAPWVAEAIEPKRPFASGRDLHEAMFDRVRALPQEEMLAFLNRHPELGGAELKAGRVTAESKSEQQSIHFNTLDPIEAAEWDTLNTAYKKRFGFPFILCVRRHSRTTALMAIRARMERDGSTELAAALEEIAWITRYRLADRITDYTVAGL